MAFIITRTKNSKVYYLTECSADYQKRKWSSDKDFATLYYYTYNEIHEYVKKHFSDCIKQIEICAIRANYQPKKLTHKP